MRKAQLGEGPRRTHRRGEGPRHSHRVPAIMAASSELRAGSRCLNPDVCVAPGHRRREAGSAFPSPEGVARAAPLPEVTVGQRGTGRSQPASHACIPAARGLWALLLGVPCACACTCVCECLTVPEQRAACVHGLLPAAPRGGGGLRTVSLQLWGPAPPSLTRERPLGAGSPLSRGHARCRGHAGFFFLFLFF